MSLGPCCVESNYHEGIPQGNHGDLFGLDTYQVGQGNKVVVILTDIHGHKYNNTLLIADEISRAGFNVLVPDILLGEPVPGEYTPEGLGQWLDKHTFGVTAPLVEKFLLDVKNQLNPSFLAASGYCFGAKYVAVNLGSDGLLDAGALLHPSLLTTQDVQAIRKPALFSLAEVDPIFPATARAEAEAALAQTGGVRYQVDLFGGVSHGFACRGDLTDPVVKYAADKALSDQICWFRTFSSGK